MRGNWPSLKTLRYGLLLAVSVAALSGCVSAVSSDMRADSQVSQETEEAVAEGSADDSTAPLELANIAMGAQAASTSAVTTIAAMERVLVGMAASERPLLRLRNRQWSTL